MSIEAINNLKKYDLENLVMSTKYKSDCAHGADNRSKKYLIKQVQLQTHQALEI